MELRLTVPTSWDALTDAQLRYVYHLFVRGLSLTSVSLHCLLHWTGLRYKGQDVDGYRFRYRRQNFTLCAEQIAAAIAPLSFLTTIPSSPVRLCRIGRHRALPPKLDGFTFGDLLALDNLYQGYLQTRRPDLLHAMARTLYRAPHLRPSREEALSVFYWFMAAKQLLAQRYPHLYRTHEAASPPTRDQLLQAMNTQIRALTEGDITREAEVLAADCHRALTELDARAREYDELKRHSHG